MSRIKVNIDCIVLSKLGVCDPKALQEGFTRELTRILKNRVAQGAYTQSSRTALMKSGQVALGADPKGSLQFGTHLARSIGKSIQS
jgi:hypothetical protein